MKTPREHRLLSMTYDDSNRRMQMLKAAVADLERMPQTARNVSALVRAKRDMENYAPHHVEIRERYFAWLRQSI